MVEITVNGKKQVFEDEVSVSKVLESRDIKKPELVRVFLNQNVLNSNSYSTTILNPGDEMEIIYLVGGGSI